MATLDIFKDDAFGLIAMTDAVNKMPFKPSMLGSMGLFMPKPITTTSVAVERKQGSLNIIQTSERGAPLSFGSEDRRDVRDFRTSRVAEGRRITTAEIQNVRAFGSETELVTIASKVAEKQDDLINDAELTFERHRLGAINGIVLDKDGSTIYNWFTEWGISQPAEITFSNTAVTSAGGMRAFVRKNILRPMVRSLGAEQPGAEVVALVGDDFYDWFTSHPDVEKTFLNWTAAAELRTAAAFEEFSFAGVRWINYRGTDDNSTVAVPPTKARFFMRGVRGLFQVAYSPGEMMEVANTSGRPFYSLIVPDRDRNMFVNVELYSYPLHLCTRPETLLRGTL